MKAMTQRQREIVDFIRSGPDQTRTSVELIDKFGREYYRHGEKYVGERLTALIRSGHIARVKKGFYTVIHGDTNQVKLF